MDDIPQPTIHDDASRDYEQFERRQLARDRDRREPGVLVIDESRASDIVDDLLSAGTVDVVPEDQVLVHYPSGQVFKSNVALAYFHKGWTAREDKDE